jgi:GTP-binding protein
METAPDANQPLALRFVLSATRWEDLPETSAEVAVVGRSNVGKSSLINALAGRKGLARTSKTPGRTQLLNLFAFTDDDPAAGATLVDCPGYGYAKASRADRNAWQDMVDLYLLHRPGLVQVLALVDGEVGPTKLDVDLLDWMRESALPFTVVATKHDKVKSSRRTRRRRDLARGCGVDERAVVWTSAQRNVNIGLLRGLVRAALGWPVDPG